MEEIPFEDRYVPKAEIDWERSWWWWYPLTRAIHPAIRITALLISAIGVWLLFKGLDVGSWLFQPRFVENVAQRYVKSLTDLPLAPPESGQSQVFQTLGARELAYLTFCLLWFTAVLGFFGGILTRRAAVELGQRTIAPWGETVRLVGSRMASYLWVTGMQLVALAGLLLLPFLLGVLASLGPVAHVSGVLLIILLPLIFIIGRLVLSMFVCYPLAVAAISCEKNADAFEGFSRSNSYFFQRPVVTALCAIALAGIGYVGYLIVYWWLLAGWHWMRDAFLTGAGFSFAEVSLRPYPVTGVEVTSRDWQAERIATWIKRGATLSWLLVSAYGFSYFWSATAAVYLILRRSVDNTNLDEIDSPYASAAVELPEIPARPAAGSTTTATASMATTQTDNSKNPPTVTISSVPPDEPA